MGNYISFIFLRTKKIVDVGKGIIMIEGKVDVSGIPPQRLMQIRKGRHWALLLFPTAQPSGNLPATVEQFKGQ